MIALFDSALKAAHEAAGAQDYPKSALYVVATPIGNLADISLRALHVLALADHIACEDTRHTRMLLRAYGIDKSSAQLLALHQHNEAQAAHRVVDLLRQGARVAYLSALGDDPYGQMLRQLWDAEGVDHTDVSSRRSQSIAWVVTKLRMSSRMSTLARSTRSASFLPSNRTRVGRRPHQCPIAPLLRPLAPCPHRPAWAGAPRTRPAP